MAQWLSWLERRPVTAEVVGSSPIWVVSKGNFGTNGGLAQLGEHLPYKQGVTGSNPVASIFVSSTFTKEYGRIPEWPKGADCKSVGTAFGGSNPPPPIMNCRGVEQSGSSLGS